MVPPSARPVAVLFLNAADIPSAACAGDGFEVREAPSFNTLFALSAVPDIEIAYVVFKSLLGSNVPAVKLDAFVKNPASLPSSLSALSSEPGPWSIAT